MTTSNQNDKLVQQYMDKMRRALKDLPPSRRQQILEDIAEHIRTARKQLNQENEASIRQILQNLGDPEVIREEAMDPSHPSNGFDRWVPWLLLFGGFLFVIGWIAGVILLWRSSTWRIRDKILGTFIWPGGLATVFMELGLPAGATTQSCSSLANGTVHCVTSTSGFHLPPAIGLPLLILEILAPIWITMHLIKVSHRSVLT
ncbi:DUF1700 domain-containing protein [Sulfobacillus thermosulfidooxidans]|uniref:DUF1700 domain-containing protein n=1 Tax=Sulfobacillus thermosulfidooxidans TaxID=28034 RepID=UPI0006B4B202|nr:hypothetical protein [Sulfobacillus thermosulfidooxidans]